MVSPPKQQRGRGRTQGSGSSRELSSGQSYRRPPVSVSQDRVLREELQPGKKLGAAQGRGGCGAITSV